MNTLRQQSRRGITLVELLVVMAIIGLLGAVSVPAFLRYLPQDNLAGTTRELYSQLKGAQVHALTFRKNAGVVYVFDNFTSPTEEEPENDGPIEQPIIDTVTGNPARVIVGMAMVEKVEEGPFTKPPFADEDEVYYAPVDASEDQWTEFPYDVCLLPIKSSGSTVEVPYEYAFFSDRPRYEPDTDRDELDELGMVPLRVIFDLEQAEGDFEEARKNPQKNFVFDEYWAWFPGHIFKPRGSMQTSGQAERFTIHMGLRPNQPVDNRIIELPDGPRQLRTRALQLYKSTGRVKDAQ
ncbi:MAG: Tfp pilus assembly protein FimT/FimU [Candidatus Hydrogenedentota bacterium]